MKHDQSASRMGTAPMGPLLFSLAIPMMVSMLFQALYNVVDSIFVSYISEAALSAVSLAFPIQNLMIAFAVGTGVGVNAYVSKSLGEGNRAEANRAAANGLLLALCTFVAFLVFGLVGVTAFMNSQTEDPAIRRYGVDYLSVCCLFSLGCMIQCMVEKLLSATGRSHYAMVTQLVGALTNIVMDPILIFGLFGFPRMEAAGAAVTGLLLWMQGGRLNVMSLGRDTAMNLGLAHRRQMIIVLLLVSVLMAVSTALVGPMTFLGFLIAMLAYQLGDTYDHRLLFPMAWLIGIVVLAGSYFVLKHLFYAEGSVGIIIEVVGGTFFLAYILRKGRL